MSRRKQPLDAPSLPPRTALAPGYRTVEQLSRGGVLDTYSVWSEERQCLCVAKVVRPDRVGEAKARRRLRAEGRLLAQLTHPHIVRLYELRERPHPVLVLEALPGETLGHLIEELGRLPVAEVAFLGLHLCSAMAYLHRKGFLHLDLKPSNIVCDAGQAKVIDFSVAKPIGPVRRGGGTRVYMAPEQARGGDLGPAADVWGIGATLYEAATGRRPFSGARPEKEYPQLTIRADPVRSHRRLPRALSAAIDACLEPTPAARPMVSEVTLALESCVEAGAETVAA